MGEVDGCPSSRSCIPCRLTGFREKFPNDLSAHLCPPQGTKQSLPKSRNRLRAHRATETEQFCGISAATDAGCVSDAPPRDCRRPVPSDYAAMGVSSRIAQQRSAASAGGKLPMGPSKRRLFNQSTHSSAGVFHRLIRAPRTSPMDDLGLVITVDGFGQSVVIAGANATGRRPWIVCSRASSIKPACAVLLTPGPRRRRPGLRSLRRHRRTRPASRRPVKSETHSMSGTGAWN